MLLDFRANLRLGFDEQTALSDALDVHHVSKSQFETWYPHVLKGEPA